MNARPEGVLLPVLRENTWSGSDQAVCEPILNSIKSPFVTFAFDSAKQRQTVTHESIEDLGLSHQELRNEALGNLVKRSFKWEILADKEGQPTVLGCSDEFASEAILVGPFMQQAQLALNAEAVLVSVPNRGVLIVQDAYPPDFSEVRRLVEWTKQTYGGTNTPVSPDALIVKDGIVQGTAVPVRDGETADQTLQDLSAAHSPNEAAPKEEGLNEEGLPREHHYGFAHRALPTALFGQPEPLWNELSGGEAQPFITNLWHFVGNALPTDARIPPDGLSLTFSDLIGGGFLAATVWLPRPLQVTEAYAACIVFKPGDRKLFRKTPPVVRYFVLEMGFADDNGSPRTYLAEYRSDGARIRLGDVAEVSEEALLLAVAEQI